MRKDSFIEPTWPVGQCGPLLLLIWAFERKVKFNCPHLEKTDPYNPCRNIEEIHYALITNKKSNKKKMGNYRYKGLKGIYWKINNGQYLMAQRYLMTYIPIIPTLGIFIMKPVPH